MALEIIQAILPIISDHTITPLARQIGYAVKYKSKVEKLRGQIKKLTDEKAGLEHSVDQATRNGDEIEDKVLNWLNDVNRAIEEAQGIVDGEEQAKERCFIGLCPNLKARYRLGREASKEALAMIELQNEAKFDRISYRPAPQQIVAPSVIGREGLPSRLSILKELMDLLKEPNLNMIGVFGMGGVGKTTLVKEVHRQALEEKLFDVVVMTDVSETPEVKKIQGQIAEAVELKLDEESDSIRAWRLQQRLMKEKRILVILDNIWSRLELEEIGIPSSNNHKGCKVLLTSRNENVLVCGMRAQEVRRLDALTDEEAKSLFEINAGDGNSNLPPIAADISKKCGGLPLLLITIASSLKNKGLHAWSDTLTRLSRFDNEGLYAKLCLVLELTYDRLPGEEVKSLFLLCALLGTSYVSILVLLKYCMGLGIFKYVETVQDARNRVYTLIDDLKASCLLLDSDKNGYVKIHDIVREVAVSIAFKDHKAFTVRDGDVLKEWPNKDVLSLCTRIISLSHCDIPNLPEKIECPEAEFLYIHTNRAWKMPNSFFEGCGKLRVLDFRETYLLSLPPSLSYLTNLHTLCLDQCTLCDLSAIGVLNKLEILSLGSSDIVALPREAEKLTQLRILDLSNCRKLSVIPANVISRLSLLEELYIGSFVEWEVGGIGNHTQRNASLAELESLSRLTTLQLKVLDAKMLPKGLFSKNFVLDRFWISIGHNTDRYQEYGTSRVLKLQLHVDILEFSVEVMLNKTEELILGNLRGIKNLVYDINSGGFPTLKHLDVTSSSDIQYFMNSVMQASDCNAFPILETLTLKNLMSLEKICHGHVAAGFFCKLKKLCVYECNRLKNLFSISLFKGFWQLEEMDISLCNNMEEIIVGDEFHDKDDENQVVEFTQLRSLRLHNLPKLRTFCCKRTHTNDKQLTAEPTSSQESLSAGRMSMPLFNGMVCFPNLEDLELSSITCEKIWQDQVSVISSSLTSLIVKKCRNLKYLFPHLVAKSPLRLKNLDISDCDFMEVIGRHTDGLEDERRMNTKILFLELDLLKLTNLPNVTRFCNGHPIECHSLRELLIENCSSLKTIISSCPSATSISNIGTESMNSQKNQHIEIHSLFDETSLKKLTKLAVQNCGSVKEIVSLKGTTEKEALVGLMSSLTEMLLIDLPRLHCIFSEDLRGVLDLKNLKLLKINNCSRMFVSTLSRELELFPNLEELSLDGMTTLTMMKSQRPLPTTFGCHVNLLEICSYRGESLNFLQRLQNIKEIIVNNSSLNELFQNGGVCDDKEYAKWTISIKNLKLNNIRDLKHICTKEWVLQDLETLKVSFCPNLVDIAPSFLSFENLTILEVYNCKKMINLVSAAAAKSLVQLVTMKISRCNELLEIIVAELEQGTLEEQEEIIFSKLKTLELLHLSCLTRFCWGNFSFTFPSLELVHVQGCPKLRTFCVGVLKTPLLESVQVTNHSYWKKKHWEGNLNATIRQLHLEMEMVTYSWDGRIKLSELPDLNELSNAQNQLKILKGFSCLNKLVVDECAFGPIVITCHVLQLLKFLKVLVVEKCDSAVQLFDFEGLSLDKGHVGLMSRLHEMHLIGLPRLRVTWNNDAQRILCFKSLKVLKVDSCSSLTKIFTLSLALGLVQLEEIEVQRCNLVEAIVTRDEEEQPTWDRTIFPSLKSIRLEHLPSLISVYSGSGILKFPVLKKIIVFHCPKMQIHASESSWEQDNNEAVCKEKFSGKIFPNLEELSLDDKAIMMIAYSPLLTEMINSKLRLLNLCYIWDKSLASSLPNSLGRSSGNLNKLRVEKCFLEELFRYGRGGRVGGGDIEEEDANCTTLPLIIRNLELEDIDGLKHLCNQGSPLDLVVLKHLETLTVEWCCDLVKLAPSSSSASFQNLTTLQVSNCDRIIYLLPSSVAKTMVQLVTMKIEECDELTGIVADEQQDDTIREEREIVFNKLKTLELIDLKNLTSFCLDEYTFTFPSLEHVILQTCPKLKIFSVGILRTAKLSSVFVKYEDDDDLGNSHWEGNLNATIQQLYADMVGFHGFWQLKLSEFSHLKEKWHNQVQFKSLYKLNNLVVDDCSLFPNALSLNHLQYLNSLSTLGIEKCDSLEQIFNLEGLDADEGQLVLMSMSKLMKLHLIDLPKLRQVWNNNSHRVLGFQNLKTLKIHDCSSLTNIFTLSIALYLVQLQDIEIKRCDSIHEIISREGEEEAAGADIILPALISITLESLPNLLSFYSGSGTLNCPFLKKINVIECPKMKIISSISSRVQDSIPIADRKRGRLCKTDFGNFSFGDKVIITSLEELRVEWNVFMNETWHMMQPHQFLHELKVMELTRIPVDWSYLPSGFLQKVPYLEKLVLSDSSLEEIFPSDSNDCEEKLTKVV